MRTLMMLSRDVKQGILKKWYLFVIPVLFAFIQAREFHVYLEGLVAHNVLYTRVTIADYFAYVMKGMPVFYFNPKEGFDIPIYWFAFQIGLAYIIAYYAYDDFLMNGRNELVALKSRSKWWISKILYCGIAVILYFALCIGVILVTAVYYNADMSWIASKTMMAYVYSTSAINLNGKDLIVLVIILPIVISLAVSEVQMFMGFIVTPVVSFAGVCTMYVLSAYYTAWYLVGNYTMWQRSSYITDDGVYPLSGLVMAVGMMVITCVCGFMYFRNKDVL